VPRPVRGQDLASAVDVLLAHVGASAAQYYQIAAVCEVGDGAADRQPGHAVLARQLQFVRQLRPRSEPAGVDLAAQVCRYLGPQVLGPLWRIGSVWASAASGPDSRRLTASRDGIQVHAWTAEQLSACITYEEQRNDWPGT